MTDWYNTFLTMKLLHLSSKDVHILLADGHPVGRFDQVWYELFHNSISGIGVYRRRSRQKKTRMVRTNHSLIRTVPIGRYDYLHIAKLVLVPYGYASPLYVESNPTGEIFVDEFRNFILESYQLTDEVSRCQRTPLNQSSHPHILLISRRNHIAHPRNMKGHVSRKISNEEKLLSELKQMGFRNSMLIDLVQLPMSEQIKLVMNTDILIGMHGAALTLSLFLPSTSCPVELFPGFWFGSNKHLSKLAELRGIQYMAYHGLPENDVSSDSSYIPVDRFKLIVLKARRLWRMRMDRRTVSC
uniref:EGF domain-specific O-linked N-acetylglucosamine transferase n=1 Tax=Trichobilharzia regenti TaxID=157069 RepID=A0AA85JAA8_TRIRE|nr:unnamed protein product [Trichobilharzia regenti]